MAFSRLIWKRVGKRKSRETAHWKPSVHWMKVVRVAGLVPREPKTGLRLFYWNPAPSESTYNMYTSLKWSSFLSSSPSILIHTTCPLAFHLWHTHTTGIEFHFIFVPLTHHGWPGYGKRHKYLIKLIVTSYELRKAWGHKIMREMVASTIWICFTSCTTCVFYFLRGRRCGAKRVLHKIIHNHNSVMSEWQCYA